MSILQDAIHAPHLSREEEYELGCKAYAGDQRARDALVVAHIGMAERWKRKFNYSDISPDDIGQAVYCGLVVAAQRFDPDNGARFSTYATWRILAEIEKLRLHETPLYRSHDSLDKEVVEGGDTLGVRMHNTSEFDPEEALLVRSLLDELIEKRRAAKEKVGALPVSLRDKELFMRFYGLGEYPTGANQTVVAKIAKEKYGISRQRLQQILRRISLKVTGESYRNNVLIRDLEVIELLEESVS